MQVRSRRRARRSVGRLLRSATVQERARGVVTCVCSSRGLVTVPGLAGQLMSESMVLVDAAGRRRSPVTTPGFLAGRAPRNKGMHYPPRSHRPGDNLDLSAGRRPERDHRRRPLAPPADHLGHRRPHALKPNPPCPLARRWPTAGALRQICRGSGPGAGESQPVRRLGRREGCDQAASRKRRSAWRISSDGVEPSD